MPTNHIHAHDTDQSDRQHTKSHPPLAAAEETLAHWAWRCVGVKSKLVWELMERGECLYMPSAATPLEGRLAETMGCKAVYTGGYVTGASRAISEPLLALDEQEIEDLIGLDAYYRIEEETV